MTDVDTAALFAHCWDEQVEENTKRSPSYGPDDYVLTGRASAAYGGKRNIAWWHDNGPGMIDAWQAWKREHGWTLWESEPWTPAVEFALDFTLPGDIAVKGYIDRIFVTPVGELAVVDIKTGRDPDTAEQLGLYATGLELLGYPRPKWGYYWMAQKGTHSQPYDLDRFTPEYFAALFTGAIAGINAGSFSPKVANNCPAWCGVSRYCYLAGGTEAVGVDPLAPALDTRNERRP